MNPTCPRCGIEIQEHKEGPCLDAWFAEKVMKWKVKEDKFSWGVYVVDDKEKIRGWFQPSTNLLHAMEGVDQLIKSNKGVHVHLLYYNSTKQWRLSIHVDYIIWNGNGPEFVKAEDIKKELAITKALIMWAEQKNLKKAKRLEKEMEDYGPELHGDS